ncbi:MAG: hypothetical protein E5Y61_01390 [Mesorhizobium sp.]|nr:MAG: hypothetical protein E5Y61_01390 [Mesorhizobium sp.]
MEPVMEASQLLGRVRRVVALAGYNYKVWFRRHRRQFFLRLRDRDIADQMADYRRSVESRDWLAALPKALALGSIAKSRGEVHLLDELSKALMRMGAYGPAAELKIARRHIVEGRVDGEWLGQDIEGLLIDLMESEKQGLATAIHHASSVGRALAPSMDAVATISNAGAHLAGALGIPPVFILGDGSNAPGRSRAIAHPIILPPCGSRNGNGLGPR